MSEGRKTLFRLADEGKNSYDAGIHIPKKSEEGMVTARLSSLADNVPVSDCSAYYPERCNNPSNDDTAVEGEISDKAAKRLNIRFEEEVYQDLIALNEVRVKSTSDELSEPADKARRHKKLDPEPDLNDFCRPTRQEFLYCDLVTDADLDGEEEESCQSYNLMNIKCDDNEDLDSDGGSESGKPTECEEEMDSENIDEDICTMQKFRLLHEKYGLEPPKLKSHFEGSTLYKRSRAWKRDEN